ncbi:DUF2150 domain-containing protein [Halobacteriales archaeon QS_8_69_26]|nr:MAG: DUF2150 domain-containing protein [Halobacteriales archaeon QS_8_69_26]
MSTSPNEFYSEERWQNWVERIRDTEVDPEDEDSARLLLNMQDDTALAVAKVLMAYDDGELDEEETLEELDEMRAIVLDDVAVDDEDTAMLVEGVQTSLTCVFESAMRYVTGGPAEEASIEEYLRAAADAEAEEDLDAAFGYVAQAGTLVAAEQDLDMSIAESLDYGYVTEWLNGLDSLQSALADPEVVEEEDED